MLKLSGPSNSPLLDPNQLIPPVLLSQHHQHMSSRICVLAIQKVNLTIKNIKERSVKANLCGLGSANLCERPWCHAKLRASSGATRRNPWPGSGQAGLAMGSAAVQCADFCVFWFLGWMAYVMLRAHATHAVTQCLACLCNGFVCGQFCNECTIMIHHVPSNACFQ